jgi:hypothetical protein
VRPLQEQGAVQNEEAEESVHEANDDDYEPSDRDEPIPTNLPRLDSPPTRLESSDNVNENSAENIDREFTRDIIVYPFYFIFLSGNIMSSFEIWDPVLAEYISLAPGIWLDYSVVNYVLMKQYYACYPEVSATYLDSYSLDLAKVDDNNSWRVECYGIPRFRRRSVLPTEGSCPIFPKVFVMRQHDHFFVVYMDHEQRIVVVFGRTNNPNGDNWEEWDGPSMYRHVCFLHGWTPGSTATVTVMSVLWEMNGVDCGPIAILTAQYLIKYGLPEHAARTLKTQAESCHHITRLKIFLSLRTWMMDSIQNYTYLRSSPPDDWLNLTMSDVFEVYDPLDAQLLGRHRELQSSRNITLQKLNTEMSGCGRCMRATRASEPQRQPPVPPDSNNQEFDEAPRERSVSIPVPIQDESLAEPCEPLAERYPPRSILNEREGQALEALDNSRTRRLHRPKVNWEEMSMERRRRTARPCDLPLPSRPLWPEHDPNYDDYWGGPTKEDVCAFRDPIHAFSLYDPLLSSVHFKSPWTTWRDNGPRLMRRFAHTYYLCRPMLLEKHVMPLVPEYKAQSSIRHFEDMHVTPRPIGRTGIPELRLVSSGDIELLGAEEMLDRIKTEGGEIDPNMLLSYFVRGRTREENYVCVDLERDGINPMDLKIDLSVDIDSFVWVADLIKVATPVGLMVTPSLRNNPGIKKHNHVYVEILEPLTDLEAAQPTRPWLERRIPLSNIPHTLFTKITEGNSPIYCYIFFPRMIHHQEYTGRQATYLPLEILVWFWNMVVLPALRFVIDSTSREPFYEFSVKEYTRKRAGKKAAGDDALYSGFSKQVDPTTFVRLQNKMRDILEEASDTQQMDRFKSFFFVVECKGFKLNVISKRGDTVMESLRHNVPQMAWDYVLDRKNGEVHMDVGFTYHPQRAKVGKQDDKGKSGVTGLWRMGYLEESFSKGGYKAGTAHPINTLAGFGALQAEMTRERSQRVQIMLRSSYNLIYEAVRKKDNDPWFCGDADAYNLTETFLSACEEKSKQYSNRGSRSYGVRDEYRVSGQAAIDILGSSEDVVSPFIILHDISMNDTFSWTDSSVQMEYCGFRPICGSNSRRRG